MYALAIALDPKRREVHFQDFASERGWALRGTAGAKRKEKHFPIPLAPLWMGLSMSK